MKLENTDITMVVSDFDGTLLRENMKEPSDKFYKVLHEMLNNEIGFIAASGRQYSNLKRMMAGVEEEIGFIAENGSLVVWKGKIVYKNSISNEFALSIIEELKKEQDVDIYVSGVNSGYIFSSNESLVQKAENLCTNVVLVKDFVDIKEDIMKVAAVYKKQIPEEAKERFRKKFGQEVSILDSGNGWLDFIPKGSGKGPALKILSKIAGFSLDHTVAFGDQENDISMFGAVKIGYAMETAYDYVKEAADNTCKIVEDILWDALYEQANRRDKTA